LTIRADSHADARGRSQHPIDDSLDQVGGGVGRWPPLAEEGFDCGDPILRAVVALDLALQRLARQAERDR
jgi:hypothetical protein